MKDNEQAEFVTATPPWSPASQAMEVMARLEALGNPGAVNKMFRDMFLLDGADLEAVEKTAFQRARQENDGSAPEFYFVCVAILSCVQTIRASESEDWNKAWLNAMDAMFWAGFAVGINQMNGAVRDVLKREKSSFARRGAQSAHSENRALKQQAIEWYEANKSTFRSKDAAAAEISQKVVPMKFRTVRDWLGKLP